MRILGKGKTGLAIKELYKDASLYDDNNIDEFDKNSDELTVVSPGIAPHHELVKDTKNLISEYDLLIDPSQFTIWISGTNGKTTTTQMITYLLQNKGAVSGGNIGTPIASLDSNNSIWVLESSSFSLHYTKSVSPNLYVLLPITEDHIDWHGSFEEYEESKLSPIRRMKEGEIAFVPQKYVDIETNAYLIGYKNSKDLADKLSISLENIEFKEPFLLDALLALAVSKVLFDAVDYKKINSFIVDEHKQEEIKDSFGRLWINDSKATNPDATIQLIKNFLDKRIYLILGGDLKGADITDIVNECVKLDCRIFTIGKSAKEIFDMMEKNGVEVEVSNTLDVAVTKIKELHTENSVAILSPSAASIDQFKSYKERGELFKLLLSF